MLDYDREARCYDATRGGDGRADRAAEAFRALAPAGAERLLDVGCGTGIVTLRLGLAGLRVTGIDQSPGMAALAAGRLPGRITVGDACALPLPDACLDVVTMVWLLHLLGRERVAAAIAEAARVLRPGGALITTVNKAAGSWAVPSDLAGLIQPEQAAGDPCPPDDQAQVTALGRRHGLLPGGQARFTGTGQGPTPQRWQGLLRSGQIRWAERAGPGRVAALLAALAALPDPGRPRPDPVYQVIALRKTSPGRQTPASW